VLPSPPFVDVTLTLLFFVPLVVPNTSTLIVHEPPIGRLPPDKLTVPEPAVAVIVPLQVAANPLGVATTSPAGRVSVNATPLS
jgi:hypothetical protein